MKFCDLNAIIKNDITFSVDQVSIALTKISFGAIILFSLAFFTFEGEYLIAFLMEKVFEILGFINGDWIIQHNNIFLHIIQLVFIVTFSLEIKYLISRYMKGWKL